MITQGGEPGGEIPYLGDIAYDYDPTRVVNSIQITQLDRQDIVTPQVAALETASGQQYGVYTDYITGYLFNDLTTAPESPNPSNLIDLANWIGQSNAAPTLRVNQVSVDAGSYPPAWPLVAGASPGDVIIVNRRPPTSTCRHHPHAAGHPGSPVPQLLRILRHGARHAHRGRLP